MNEIKYKLHCFCAQLSTFVAHSSKNPAKGMNLFEKILVQINERGRLGAFNQTKG